MKITKIEKCSAILFVIWFFFVIFLAYKIRLLMRETTELRSKLASMQQVLRD